MTKYILYKKIPSQMLFISLNDRKKVFFCLCIVEWWSRSVEQSKSSARLIIREQEICSTNIIKIWHLKLTVKKCFFNEQPLQCDRIVIYFFIFEHLQKWKFAQQTIKNIESIIIFCPILNNLGKVFNNYKNWPKWRNLAKSCHTASVLVFIYLFSLFNEIGLPPKE